MSVCSALEHQTVNIGFSDCPRFKVELMVDLHVLRGLFYSVLTKYYLEALSCPTCDSYPDNFFLQVLIFWPGVIVWNSFPSPPISSCCIKENRKSVTPLLFSNYCAIHKPHTVQLETTCKTTLNPLPSELCHLQQGVFSFIAAVIDVVTSAAAAAAVAGVVFILLTLLLLLLLLFLLLLFLVSSVTVLVLSLSRQW